jgi:aspartate/methionine/tyrosine aminotransferase
VPLRLNENQDWVFDPEELRAALKRPEAKVFLFTNPHNPCGKVFTVEELQIITDILNECPHVIVLEDAVYCDLTFDDRKHNYLCTFANNWDRTVSMFSAGKLMNITGWRIGWAIGPERLIHYGGIIAVTLFECWNPSG